MENKKLTNLKPGTDDSDVLTKKQIYDHIKANVGSSSSPPIDLTDYLKKDGSVPMTGHLQMNFNRISKTLVIHSIINQIQYHICILQHGI